MKIEKMPGWEGKIDRIQTEEKLSHQKLGTYVLRNAEELTKTVLSETNKTLVKAYLITIKDREQKIAEQLVIHTKKGWTIYRDNPNLNDTDYYKYFKTFEEALKKLEPRAKTPLRTKS